MGQFRKGEANDPGTYVTSVAYVLSRYSDDIIVAATDPRTGLASTTDWLPTIREVTAACEMLSAEAAEFARRDQIIRETLALRKAADGDRAERLTMDELRARHGPNWGFKGQREELAAAHGEGARRQNEREERAILAEYERLGIEPLRAGDVLISPALLKTIGRLVGRGTTE
jgi:hypothetical protein